MRIGIWRAVALAALMCASGACTNGRTADARRGVVSAAATPIRDVGLIRPEIPPILRTLGYPYSTASLSAGCSAVSYEIGQLDAVLGPESFQPGPARNIWDRSGDLVEQQAVDAFQDTAEDIIPFRSWVRRLSGASQAERDALRAFANGQQRRTFLRGYGASLGCPAVVPPPPPRAAS
ncbi:MAG: hypothetical protein WDM79_04830 [Terricaulis sp.]